MDYPAIHTAALAAAQEKAAAYEATQPPDNKRGLDCGFAWVQISPATHPFVRWLKANGHGSKHWDKGWYLWGSSLHRFPTQSIETHRQAALGYADYIREALKGDARADYTVGSRYD